MQFFAESQARERRRPLCALRPPGLPPSVGGCRGGQHIPIMLIAFPINCCFVGAYNQAKETNDILEFYFLGEVLSPPRPAHSR
jgi:hypothetical protein